jgi:hypothetical protein
MENLIKKNIELFNEAEPFDGHFERFANKLSNYRTGKTGLRRKVIYIVSTAAVVLMLIGFAGRTIYTKNMNYQPVYLLGNVSEELAEAENYFNNEINERFELIKKSNKIGNNYQKYQILKDFNQTEEDYKMLMKDFYENPYDERIINAIIMHYEKKIELLDDIISKTNKIEI